MATPKSPTKNISGPDTERLLGKAAKQTSSIQQAQKERICREYGGMYDFASGKCKGEKLK